MQRTRHGHDRSKLKAGRNQAHKSNAKVAQDKSAYRLTTEQKTFHAPATTLKPGTLSTFLMLSVLGSVVTPALGALAPRVFSNEQEELRNLIDAKLAKSNDLSIVNCAPVMRTIYETSQINSAANKRIVKVLKDPNVKLICPKESPRLTGLYIAKGSALKFTNDPGRSLDSAKVDATFHHVENHLMHEKPKCKRDGSAYRCSPLGDTFTPEKIDALNAAMDKGDARILQFKQLLDKFKSMEASDAQSIDESLSSGDNRLRMFNSLIFRFKMRGKLPFTDAELALLTQYMNAAKNCILNDAIVSVGSFEYEKPFYVALDKSTNTYIKFENGNPPKYHHTFDSVANHVERVHAAIKHLHTPLLRLTEREGNTVSSLSEEALNVFYPELVALRVREEEKCDAAPPLRMGGLP